MNKRWCVLLILLIARGVSACNVNGGSLVFGQIDPIANIVTYGSTQLSVTCPEETSYSIHLSSGQGNYAARQMSNGGSQMHYNIYDGPSYSQVWGDGNGGTVSVAGSAGPGGSQHTLYGRVPAQPKLPVGQYTDNIVITVSY